MAVVFTVLPVLERPVWVGGGSDCLRDSSNGLGVCKEGAFCVVVGCVCKCLGNGSHTRISIKSPTCSVLVVVDIAALSLRAAADTDPVLALPVVVLMVPSSANKGLAVLPAAVFVAASEPACVPPTCGELAADANKACGRTAVGTEVTEEDDAPIVVLALLVPNRSGCKHSGVPSKCSASCTFKETRPECRLAQPITMTPAAPAAAVVAVPVATVATEPVVVVALLLLAKIWL
jgi:hypothetical protein